jgi:hypothetical protein
LLRLTSLGLFFIRYGWMDGWMDGWMKRQTSGMLKCIFVNFVRNAQKKKKQGLVLVWDEYQGIP